MRRLVQVAAVSLAAAAVAAAMGISPGGAATLADGGVTPAGLHCCTGD